MWKGDLSPPNCPGFSESLSASSRDSEGDSVTFIRTRSGGGRQRGPASRCAAERDTPGPRRWPEAAPRPAASLGGWACFSAPVPLASGQLFHCHHQSHSAHDSARRGQNHRPRAPQNPRPHPALPTAPSSPHHPGPRSLPAPSCISELPPRPARAGLQMCLALSPSSTPAPAGPRGESARFSRQVVLTPGRLSRSISQPPLRLGALPQGF